MTTDSSFCRARGILANGNNGESVTESLDRTDSVRDIQLLYSENDTTLFLSFFGLDNGDQFRRLGEAFRRFAVYLAG
jgi:hypothetical protein